MIKQTWLQIFHEYNYWKKCDSYIYRVRKKWDQ